MIPGEVWDDRSTTSSDSMNMSIDVEVIDTIASPKVGQSISKLLGLKIVSSAHLYLLS